MDHYKSKGSVKGVILLSSLVLLSCNANKTGETEDRLFTLLNNRHTQIDFINNLEYTEEFNTYTYRNFYNGAGVGIGDFNNDLLPDIYFCSNQTGNRLYLNNGDFRFSDITDSAGVSCKGSWSTGVSIADINGDGWLDIYVCKSGMVTGDNRHNELFINNGDLTFSEESEKYGLAVTGLSNHASFFDYDRDGDLDCYLLNNSLQSVTDFDIKPGQRNERDTLGGNMLFQNVNGRFEDVSRVAGIYGSKIGFGLGVSIGDLNRDGWQDIYVANDFFERDYLYLNNKDGTFTESLEECLREISLGAMGADIADLNNDTWPEIFVTEMTPEGNARRKTKAVFETWDRYQWKLQNGYYRQFARNVLQLNNRNGTFSETGRFSGVSSTDWSWGALIFDIDNDGWKDIFVANGIFKDLLDLDYLDIYSNPSVMRSLIKTEEEAILRLIDKMPSAKVPNYAFHNNGDMTFTNLADSWGLNTPSFSNGAAYGDLDNDGDLDLVINNVNMPPFIYRNEITEKTGSGFLSVSFRGEGLNSSAVGAELTLYSSGSRYFGEMIPSRGFQSSSDHRVHFGLGSAEKIDSLEVVWPDGRFSVLYDIAVNQFLKLDQKDVSFSMQNSIRQVKNTPFQLIVKPSGFEYSHKENEFNDFDRDRLLFHMLSNEGPHLAAGDINSDGLDDVFICGAKDSPGVMFVSKKDGSFRRTGEKVFDADRISEDTDCAFLDADNDGDPDLYVASGGNEFPESSSALIDRLYLNDGIGNFTRSSQILPSVRYESTSCIKPSDYDKDGITELFAGIRLIPFSYGLPAGGRLLENDGKGNFRDVTMEKAKGLINLGMITDMEWADVDNDGDQDMIIAGEWMPLKLFINEDGFFTDRSADYGLLNTEGWWHTIAAGDINHDGYIDLIAGNHGLNSFFKASASKPVSMYVNDFDLNGSIEQIICTFIGDTSYPVVRKDELISQIPSLGIKYRLNNDYKDQTIEDLFPPEILNRSVKLEARILESCILLNTGSGSFQINTLPAEAQYFPVYAILAEDFDNDGYCDILIGGNQYRAKPETGIYDAGYGLFLKGEGNGKWQPVPALSSGFLVKGEIRDFAALKINGKRIIAVARNNDNLQFFNY